MKTATGILILGSGLLLAAGCKTTESKPLSWKDQSAYLSGVRDPRVYGISIYQTPSGIDFRGGGRLHPNQMAALEMKSQKPLRPVVMSRTGFGKETPVLLDFTATHGWMEFDFAKSVGALPLGEREAKLVKPANDDISGSLSVLPNLRFGQLHVERPLMIVRMASKALGPAARGIEKPAPKASVGWDVLRKFEQILLDYADKRVLLSTTSAAYRPDPSRLVAEIPLVPHAGVCAVRGQIDGKAGLILIDPAGDFEIATDGAAPVSSIDLGGGLVFSAPAISESPGGTRIGARLLQNYNVTLRPQAGTIYFEKK